MTPTWLEQLWNQKVSTTICWCFFLMQKHNSLLNSSPAFPLSYHSWTLRVTVMTCPFVYNFYLVHSMKTRVRDRQEEMIFSSMSTNANSWKLHTHWSSRPIPTSMQYKGSSQQQKSWYGWFQSWLITQRKYYWNTKTVRLQHHGKNTQQLQEVIPKTYIGNRTDVKAQNLLDKINEKFKKEWYPCCMVEFDVELTPGQWTAKALENAFNKKWLRMTSLSKILPSKK